MMVCSTFLSWLFQNYVPFMELVGQKALQRGTTVRCLAAQWCCSLPSAAAAAAASHVSDGCNAVWNVYKVECSFPRSLFRLCSVRHNGEPKIEK